MADRVGDPPLWDVAATLAHAVPCHALEGAPHRTIAWLSSAATEWLRHPNDEGTGLRAGLGTIGSGSFQETLEEAQDSFVLGGRADIVVDGNTLPLDSGTAIALNPRTQISWTVHEPLTLFTVFAGTDEPKVPPGQPVRTTFDQAQLSRYQTDHLRDGTTERDIAWLREGPEGTGGFFSGLFTISESSYEKQFVVNEFVLLLEGEKQIDVAGYSYRFRAGTVAAYSKGWVCRRTITQPVKQFFAGR